MLSSRWRQYFSIFTPRSYFLSPLSVSLSLFMSLYLMFYHFEKRRSITCARIEKNYKHKILFAELKLLSMCSLHAARMLAAFVLTLKLWRMFSAIIFAAFPFSSEMDYRIFLRYAHQRDKNFTKTSRISKKYSDFTQAVTFNISMTM